VTKYRSMSKSVRVRFAPSPTGALHIGGVRTALFNYLFAKKNGGIFILRIEDTDQNRYVAGAEAYITESLKWLGLHPDESPESGGIFGPYRQSERKSMYAQYALELVAAGRAYYAFDSVEELEQMRERSKVGGDHAAMYGAATRMNMRNSLTLMADEVQRLLDSGASYVIRMKIPANGEVKIQDEIRGEVVFQFSEMDDKVLLKGDGMPTYHLANIVDDHLMEISHVIRGEEWLSSTGHHVLLHQWLGWEGEMPSFAHLPLILKPDGKGKLSKRDGTRLGIPVFPLSWNDPDPQECFNGFREMGYESEAVINFLALLGWNPGTEQEIFSLSELIEVFSLDRVSKGGARFDIEKAKWFNQYYLKNQNGAQLAGKLSEMDEKMAMTDHAYLAGVCELMKERVTVYKEIPSIGYYFFEYPKDYDQQVVNKRWTTESEAMLISISDMLREKSFEDAKQIEVMVKDAIQANGWNMGTVFQLLRLSISGTLQGPDLFAMIHLIGAQELSARIRAFIQHANKILTL
jgi:glutamyl-tRNA synthetase